MPTSLQGRARRRPQVKRGIGSVTATGGSTRTFWKQCWRDIRQDAAAGVDQVRAQASEQHLDAHIHDLVELRTPAAVPRHTRQTTGRSHRDGTPRPLGSPAGEEKLLQRAERASGSHRRAGRAAR